MVFEGSLKSIAPPSKLTIVVAGDFGGVTGDSGGGVEGRRFFLKSGDDGLSEAEIGGLVSHFFESQAIGRGAERRFLVAFCGGVDEIVEVVLPKEALGGLHGCAGEEADHFVEESVAGDGDEVAVGDLFEVGAGDLADVVGVFGLVAPLGGEGAEVV